MTQADQTTSPTETDAKLARVAVRIPDILLPSAAVDLQRWAVVACDQYTSQPDYWQEAEQIVGEAPSTLRLTFPEVYLEDSDANSRVADIKATMRDYLQQGVFHTFERAMVLVRRQMRSGAQRWGLVVALDLDAYSWESDSRTLIRSTEGTILDRLPPRVRIREGAAVELPHILVLLSDEARSVIEPMAARRAEFSQVYDTELMLDGGRVTGWAISADADLGGVADALQALKANLDPGNRLLFAMGDGNHSFATAKSIWEKVKSGLSVDEQADHPARFCLVELVNIFDEGLTFEPIHRVLFGLSRADFEAELSGHCAAFETISLAGVEEIDARLNTVGPGQRFGFCDESGVSVYELHDATGAIPAATVQNVVNSLVDRGVCTVDYIHGTDVTAQLGQADDNIGIFLPAVAKDSFFEAIVRDGALPRKTFSMGEAGEKRYYLEARGIDEPHRD